MRLGQSAAGIVSVRQTDAVAFYNNDVPVDNEICFFGVTSTGAGGAGLNSRCQLLNPAGSGIEVLIDRVHISVDTAQQIRITTSALAEATLTTARTNKKLGGVDPVAELRFATVGGFPGTTVGFVRIQASDFKEFELPFPFLLPAAQGIVFTAGTANTPLEVIWEWREV